MAAATRLISKHPPAPEPHGAHALHKEPGLESGAGSPGTRSSTSSACQIITNDTRIKCKLFLDTCVNRGGQEERRNPELLNTASKIFL